MKKRPPVDDQMEKVASDVNISERPRKKKRRPVESSDDASTVLTNEFEIVKEESEQKYSNIPPKHIREAREKEMRENYQNMVDEEDDEGGSPVILILIIIILLLAIAAFAGYWFLLR